MKMQEFLARNRKVFIAVTLLAAVYIILYIVFRQNQISRTEIEEFLAPLGAWGILAAYLIQVLTSMTPLPDAPLAFVTMILYGPYAGSAAIFIGMLTATTINYAIASRLGTRYILGRFPLTASYLKRYGKNATFESLLLLRFFSFVTFDIVSYIAALSGVPFWKFFFELSLRPYPPCDFACAGIAGAVYRQSA
ncbi:MAG: TVP38/TMEM64 family inner membrane protein YdjZ [candidate division WS6 bacterium OLB20]|uniref:TVP38/TMEM64 family membrane protein n=1 Tax=candidate division WS6 bacterium OLB20 TaxID=1617426 RepID=A0A136M0B3_9BACT|nr:MAG: TVP38/TMEM64 family inner membrane protein YdjZ [candidate division WS6 bacterium OLB20]